MKKGLVLLVCVLFHANLSYCQLADGSTAPDFTFTDINGNTQNLYSYLNAGKYVALEVSATWCHPCWLYHQTGTLDSLYTLHDVPGDHTWKVLFLEGDGNTTLADLQGTGTNTQGNWVAGSLFPIMNPSGITLNDFLSNYNNSFFPTLYIICPNKKVYQDTLNKGSKPLVSRWEYVASNFCSPVGIDDIKDANPVTIFPNPARDHTVLYFSLNKSAELTLTIANVLGQTVETKNFGILQAGDHSLKYDLGNLEKGIYIFTLSGSYNRYVRKKVVVE
ncbi:MAG: T9SS type A sorting domain-containing protein [Taibaiella sp.]|nr:T9SS type A sorting domain-containing protein [Taibaiella sp.]